MFRSGFMQQHYLQEIIEPRWIKARHNNRAKPRSLSFRSFREELPLYIDIPGENMKSKVYEYKERPVMCKKCLQYGHTKNSCRDNQRCAKSGEDNHEVAKYTTNEPRCLHCSLTFEASTTPAAEQAFAQSVKAIRHCAPEIVQNNPNTTAAGRNAHCGQP